MRIHLRDVQAMCRTLPQRLRVSCTWDVRDAPAKGGAKRARDMRDDPAKSAAMRARDIRDDVAMSTQEMRDGPATSKTSEDFTNGIFTSRWPEQIPATATARGGVQEDGMGVIELSIQLGITESAYKNQLVMVSVQYGPFSLNIPTESMTIGKSRVPRDSIVMHTSWRSKSDIACAISIGYPRTRTSVESSTAKHRLLHTSGPHPIPPPDDRN
ncbi:hypothetical protein F511_40650 [Dorcoceras hygrometricum]|uniref:Uncharacterized protein n=1 Tax=Dorcoceras hygrometricum TaxID=472368 RepID=A0A2Z7C2P0_9LAMI|nr:hypothetical protein F511_40650 [Dorcoceras hygrometricum]